MADDVASTTPTYANLCFQQAAWNRVLTTSAGVLNPFNFIRRRAHIELVGVSLMLADLEAAREHAVTVVGGYETMKNVYGIMHPDITEALERAGEVERVLAHSLRNRNLPSTTLFTSALKHLKRALDAYGNMYGGAASVFGSGDFRIIRCKSTLEELLKEFCDEKP
ncbi:hypothetical protein HDU93_003103 [Gonapodya sp. JEL0774]|nr:hypothetical protein HDU93_003103 [Gonapodya sp. JEL0774]